MSRAAAALCQLCSEQSMKHHGRPKRGGMKPMDRDMSRLNYLTFQVFLLD